MQEYTTVTTACGKMTYLLLGEATVAIFVYDDHAELAAHVAAMLNAQMDDAVELAGIGGCGTGV